MRDCIGLLIDDVYMNIQRIKNIFFLRLTDVA